ncbi:MAG TPA: polysaccharide deacetylase family protein [Mycobacteriales bacterium]|nr:polysaccharide deacetylase family protein [Mycobacteriales bacterium]
MSQQFPGPSRPSRSVARRSVVAGLAVVAVGSAVDLVRMLVRGADSRALADPNRLTRRTVNLLTGNLRPEDTTPRPTEPAATALPRHTHAPSHHHGNDKSHGKGHAKAHGKGHGKGHGKTHGHEHHSGHGHTHDHHKTKAERERARRREHVKLPPPQLHVRTSPAYRVDQLIPNPPEQALALTIDDGPDPEYTPDVLRLLDKYQMQASFCVIGVHADAYPKLVRDVVRAGHIVVNHSYTHMLPFTRLPEKRIVTEITRTQRAIERAAGVTPQLFRSPGGEWSRFIFRAIAAYGLEPLDWDVDPRDWARPGTKKIARRMLKAKPGEIVLCHDGGGDRAETVRALRRVLPTWQRKGLLTIPLHITPHYLPDHAST